MAAKKTIVSTLVVIAILAVTFGALYVFGAFGKEKFTLLPLDKVMVYQGSQMPDTLGGQTPLKVDAGDPSLTSIDGSLSGPKSMFMFSYNKCDPKCCDYSPYSCSSGCVCMTPEQINFIGTRGKNNKYNKCSPPPEDI
jgi:hypothetical protein